MDPRLRLATVPNLEGLIAVRPPADPALAAGHIDAHIVDASASDTVATMMLIIPQLNGRDLDDLDIVQRDGAEWTRFGSYMHQPLSSVPMLPNGAKEVVTIGPAGYAEWRAVASDVAPVQVTITTTGAWHLYDPAFTTVANGKGSDVACLPAGNGLCYLTLFGDPGQTDTRFHIVDASVSDTVATMMLIIPQLNGRDLDDLDIVQRDGAEWTRFGSYMPTSRATRVTSSANDDS